MMANIKKPDKLSCFLIFWFTFFFFDWHETWCLDNSYHKKKTYTFVNQFLVVSKNLVIVESPAKAKTIEKFLGKDFKVVSSNGHIADLPSKELGINIENNYEPKYIIF